MVSTQREGRRKNHLRRGLKSARLKQSPWSENVQHRQQSNSNNFFLNVIMYAFRYYLLVKDIRALLNYESTNS